MNSRQAGTILRHIMIKIHLIYNVLELGSPDKQPKTRCNNFAIYYKQRDNYLIIEYIKGRLIVSCACPTNEKHDFDFNEFIHRFPMRFQEIIGEIKQSKSIDETLLKDIIEKTIKGVKGKRIEFLRYHDSRASVILFTLNSLSQNIQKHTYIYQNLPFFGKNNSLFRASTKLAIGEIEEFLDTEK